MQDISYLLDNSLYLNITSRCTNACSFCIRYKTHKFHGKYALWLEHEPSTQEILKQIGDPGKYEQIVFCGYGEPLLRLEIVKEVCSALHASHPALRIRIDTNGLMNLFYGRDILPELKGLVDIMSISLNAENAEIYNALCSPTWGLKSYPAIISFIKEAKKYIREVEASVVNLPNIVDIEKCRKIADELGVKFRVRTYYEEKYVP